MWAQKLIGAASFSLVDVPEEDFDQGTPDQVLIEVLAGGICGSDLPLFKGVTPLNRPSLAGTPGYPLHEVVGRVVRSQSGRLAADMRVVGWAPRLNGICEKLVVSATDVQEYDAALPPTTAVLLQPLACVLGALAQVRDRTPASAAVIGQGPIGILFSHVLKSFGVRCVIGVDPVDRTDVAGRSAWMTSSMIVRGPGWPALLMRSAQSSLWRPWATRRTPLRTRSTQLPTADVSCTLVFQIRRSIRFLCIASSGRMRRSGPAIRRISRRRYGQRAHIWPSIQNSVRSMWRMSSPRSTRSRRLSWLPCLA
jgi:hypothetical protein